MADDIYRDENGNPLIFEEGGAICAGCGGGPGSQYPCSCSGPPIEVYYPSGESVAPDGTIKSNADIAKEIIEGSGTGKIVVMPAPKKED